MGFGDVTLMAFVGAALGPHARCVIGVSRRDVRRRRVCSASCIPVALLRRGHAASRPSSRSAARPSKLRMCRSVYSLRLLRCWRCFGETLARVVLTRA